MDIFHDCAKLANESWGMTYDDDKVKST